MSNLLVIDFDAFFPNPCEAGLVQHGAYQLYDWAHGESRFYVDGPVIWPSRASGFWAQGVPLPRCEVPEDFWDRFDLAEATALHVADSNAYAGVVQPPDGCWGFDEVYLFDAHHDCYSHRTPEDVQAMLLKDEISCEDWMFVHLSRGSRLHWRWPSWLKNGHTTACTVPEFVHLDARVDDGKQMDVQFDAVFLCRSGAWVPPWCDDQFQDFLAACPLPPVFYEGPDDVAAREWEPMARTLHAGWSNDLLHRIASCG